MYILPMKILNFYVSEPQLAKLRTLAGKLDFCVAELIRRAIDAFLEKQK